MALRTRLTAGLLLYDFGEHASRLGAGYCVATDALLVRYTCRWTLVVGRQGRSGSSTSLCGWRQGTGGAWLSLSAPSFAQADCRALSGAAKFAGRRPSPVALHPSCLAGRSARSRLRQPLLTGYGWKITRSSPCLADDPIGSRQDASPLCRRHGVGALCGAGGCSPARAFPYTRGRACSSARSRRHFVSVSRARITTSSPSCACRLARRAATDLPPEVRLRPQGRSGKRRHAPAPSSTTGKVSGSLFFTAGTWTGVNGYSASSSMVWLGVQPPGTFAAVSCPWSLTLDSVELTRYRPFRACLHPVVRGQHQVRVWGGASA